MGCLPCRLHWFLPEEGCRGRREEAATLTPDVVVLLVAIGTAIAFWIKKKYQPRYVLIFFNLKCRMFLLFYTCISPVGIPSFEWCLKINLFSC